MGINTPTFFHACIKQMRSVRTNTLTSKHGPTSQMEETLMQGTDFGTKKQKKPALNMHLPTYSYKNTILTYKIHTYTPINKYALRDQFNPHSHRRPKWTIRVASLALQGNQQAMDPQRAPRGNYWVPVCDSGDSTRALSRRLRLRNQGKIAGVGGFVYISLADGAIWVQRASMIGDDRGRRSGSDAGVNLCRKGWLGCRVIATSKLAVLALCALSP